MSQQSTEYSQVQGTCTQGAHCFCMPEDQPILDSYVKTLVNGLSSGDAAEAAAAAEPDLTPMDEDHEDEQLQPPSCPPPLKPELPLLHKAPSAVVPSTFNPSMFGAPLAETGGSSSSWESSALVQNGSLRVIGAHSCTPAIPYMAAVQPHCLALHSPCKTSKCMDHWIRSFRVVGPKVPLNN